MGFRFEEQKRERGGRGNEFLMERLAKRGREKPRRLEALMIRQKKTVEFLNG